MVGLVLERGLSEWRKVIIDTTHRCFFHGGPFEAKARKGKHLRSPNSQSMIGGGTTSIL